jgi:hypothetical protein
MPAPSEEWRLAAHHREQFVAADPMGRVMRTRIDTTHVAPLIANDIATQIAGSRPELNDGPLGRRVEPFFPVHIDVAVGTVFGAQTASDAVVFNLDFRTLRIGVAISGGNADRLV